MLQYTQRHLPIYLLIHWHWDYATCKLIIFYHTVNNRKLRLYHHKKNWSKHNPNASNFISFFCTRPCKALCYFCFIKNVNRNADNKSHKESSHYCRILSVHSKWLSVNFHRFLSHLRAYERHIIFFFIIFYLVVYLVVYLSFFSISFFPISEHFCKYKKKITYSVSLHSYEVTTSQLRFQLNNDNLLINTWCLHQRITDNKRR